MRVIYQRSRATCRIGDCKRPAPKLRKAAGLWESLSHAGDRTAIALLDALPENCGMTFEKRPPEATLSGCARRRFTQIGGGAALCHRPALAQNKLRRLARRQIVRRRRREARGGAQRFKGRRTSTTRGSTRRPIRQRLTRTCSGAYGPTSARASTRQRRSTACVARVPRRRGATGAGIASTSGAGADRPRDLDALKKALQAAARGRGPR